VAKICRPAQLATGDIMGSPCMPEVFGTCEGLVGLVFRYNKIFNPATGAFFQPSDFVVDSYNRGPISFDRSIKGRILCMTEPTITLNGDYFALLRTSNPPAQVAFDYLGITIGNKNNKFGTPKFIGLIYYEKDCLTDNICRCTDGDETINCNSATGGICCISKSILDRLCKKI
jgi:hypothetical protein